MASRIYNLLKSGEGCRQAEGSRVFECWHVSALNETAAMIFEAWLSAAARVW